MVTLIRPDTVVANWPPARAARCARALGAAGVQPAWFHVAQNKAKKIHW